PPPGGNPRQRLGSAARTRLLGALRAAPGRRRGSRGRRPGGRGHAARPRPRPGALDAGARPARRLALARTRAVSVLRPARLAMVLLGLCCVVLATATLGLTAGPSPVGARDALHALLDPTLGGPAADIVRGIRLPRVGAALGGGGCLAGGGVRVQGPRGHPR